MHHERQLRQLFHHWSAIDGPTWNDDQPLLPSHLTPQERTVALGELRAIPEHFYTTTKLPIITPDNYQQFMRTIIPNNYYFFMFSLCSGSSRLLLTALQSPFDQVVLFPIDLRYGWDLKYEPHRRIITIIDHYYKPFLTTMEPRCKYWSNAGSRREPQLTEQLRNEERPMLTFLSNHGIKVVKDNRAALAENPKTSALWNRSPFENWQYLQQFEQHSRTTCQCAFTPHIPDGQRHKKETMLKSSFQLVHSTRPCSCRQGHVQLRGYDSNQHKVLTAAAALFPARFCRAICMDALDHYNRLQKTKGRKKPLLEQPQQPTTGTRYFNIGDDPPIDPPPGLQLPASSSSASSSDNPPAPAQPAAPGLDTSVSDRTPDEHLKGIPVDHLSFTGVPVFALCDQNLIKACLMDFWELMLGATRSPDPIVCLHKPGQLQPYNTISVFLRELNKMCNTYYVYVLKYQEQLPPVPDQLQLHCNLSECSRILVQLRDDATFDCTLHYNLADPQLQQPFKLAHILCVIIYAKLLPEARKAIADTTTPPLRLRDKTATSSTTTPTSTDLVPAEDQSSKELIKATGKRMTSIKPTFDLKHLPTKLANAEPEERKRLLTGLHERFWHAGPGDMLRLLEAMMVPRHIVAEGLQAVRDCPQCKTWANKMPKPTVKAYIATTFNETVQHDLFFLWDEPFMLLIDEAIRWKTGDHLMSKASTVLLKRIFGLWLRLFGPMRNFLTDQEGGLVSNEATAFFDRFNITRLLAGTGGSHTKGLVERHISLVKHSMLIMNQEARKSGLKISHSELCQEVCMSQNLMLEHNGGTPQTALTGQTGRGWWMPDSDIIQSTASANDAQPDFAEHAIRSRLLAKQCIMQSIIQERIAQATKMRQHVQPPAVLLPGTLVDVYRKPDRKDEFGWHGPAELVSLNRRAGSCIAVHQGIPLILPFSHIRKHVLQALYNYYNHFANDNNHNDIRNYYCNYQLVSDLADIHYNEVYITDFNSNYNSDNSVGILETTKSIMDITDGEPPGKLLWIGIVFDEDNNFTYKPSKEVAEQHSMITIGTKLLQQTTSFTTIHGVIYGTDLRRLPGVRNGTVGMLLRWKRDNRLQYQLQELSNIQVSRTFRGNQFEGWSTVLYYNFADNHDDYNKVSPDYDDLDWDDISSIDPTSVPSSPTTRLRPPTNDAELPAEPSQPSTMTPPKQPHLSGTPFSIPPGLNSFLPATTPTDGQTPSPQQPFEPPITDNPSLSQPSNPDTSPFTDQQPRQLPEPSTTDALPPAPPTPQPDDIMGGITPGHHPGTQRERSRTPPRTPSNHSNSNSPYKQTATADLPQPGNSSSSTTEQPVVTPPLPLADNSAPSSTEPPAPAELPEVPQSDSDATVPYDDELQHSSADNSNEQSQQPSTDDSQRTIEYDENGEVSNPNTNNFIHHLSNIDHNHYDYHHLISHFINNSRTINHFTSDLSAEMDTLTYMSRELTDELRTTIDATNDYIYQDLVTGEIFRVDDETANLTDDEMVKYGHLVHAADHKELKSFIDHNVFKTTTRQPGDNVVDCVWIRKWKIKGKMVKSRMCARGCFDRQKWLIEKHSSTATRLSQRLVVSLCMADGIIHGDNIDVESLDISTAFLQGLEYSTLDKLARDLGYENRIARRVLVMPPENVWRHFRKMANCPKDLKISDNNRVSTLLLCLKAMYGFADAPLMFQLALLQYLVDDCEAIKSLFDNNYLYWLQKIDGQWHLILVLTAHVDDLQITGGQKMRDWLHGRLESRFGELKRQRLPYTHAGIQQERIGTDCLRLHQDHFCSKLATTTIGKHRLDNLESPLDASETTTFRSLTCSALWAAQTNPQEVCQITSLQTALKKPMVKDLVSINQVIKRLKSPNREKWGIWFRRLEPPYRCVTVSDASPATKKSDYATEGICATLAEDRLPRCTTDDNDFLDPSLVKFLGGKFHLLASSSTKAKRVSHSTSHAETNAAARTVPLGQLIGMRLTEPDLYIYFNPKPLTPLLLLQMDDSMHRLLPHDHLVDCMDLWELACGLRGIPQDKGQRLGVLAIREERRSLRLRRLFHVRTHWMLCDPLTKFSGYVSKSLFELLTSGVWTLDGTIRVRHQFGGKAKQVTFEQVV